MSQIHRKEDEIDANWIHEKLPASLVKSISMLKNGGNFQTAPEITLIAPNNAIPNQTNRNSLVQGASLDHKLATLRNEMVSD